VDFSARRSFFAELFDSTGLVNAVSLDIAALTGSSMIGPLLAGALIASVGFLGAYGLMVVLYIVGFVLLLTVRSPGRVTAPITSVEFMSQFAAALNMIRTTRVLWVALTITVGLNFFGFPFLLMVPVIARDVLGADALFFGILMAASGLGSLTGALVIASRTIHRQGTVYSLGAILMLASIVLFAVSSFYPLSVIFLFLTGIGMAGFATMQPAIALQAVPPEMRGRAMGAIALGIGASPVGMFVVGQAADLLGPQMALALLAGAGFVVLNILRLALPELRR
jgi:MFS family permease